MLEERVAAYMKMHRMTETGSHVLVGVSGGADSVCLLLMLSALKEQLGIRLSAVHVHHGIRGKEADRDQAYVTELCEKHQIPCYTVQENVPEKARQWHMSLEEAARQVRYDAFRRTAGEIGAEVIAVAHHLEDNEETILMHLLRGSGLRGVSGIQPVSGNIIRPLLEVSRGDIEEWLTKGEISWVTDGTNLSEEYTRNYVRRCLMPELTERFPQAGRHLRSFAHLAGETERYLQRQAAALFSDWGSVSGQEARIEVRGFTQADPVLQPYILRYAMEQAGIPLKDITARHFMQIQELFYKPVGKRLYLPAGIVAVREYEQVLLGREKGEEVSFSLPEMEIQVFPYEKNREILKKPYAKWFDYDKITDAVVLRTRQKGDRFSPLPYGSKKLKDYMIDVKIPQEKRDRIPLVAAGSTILWVVGYRMSEAYKVTPQTKRVLQVTIVNRHG